MRAMPYLYTAFFDANQYGCPVMRPLFFAFPADENVYGTSSGTGPSNTQFLIGDGLLINPVTVVRLWMLTASVCQLRIIVLP